MPIFRKIILVGLVAVWSWLIQPVRAEDVDSGSFWLETCTGKQTPTFTEGMCLGYIHGLQAFQRLLKTSSSGTLKFFCLPEGATLGKSRAVIVKFLVDNPSLRHLPFEVLAVTALADAYPCEQDSLASSIAPPFKNQ
jgi:Ssp1 endopeptidase immunity protein Rap1a